MSRINFILIEGSVLKINLFYRFWPNQIGLQDKSKQWSGIQNRRKLEHRQWKGCWQLRN